MSALTTRPVIPTLLVAALKGGTGGFTLGAIAYLLFVRATIQHADELAIVAGCFALAGANLCAVDAVSVHFSEKWQRAACRFAAGFFTPLAGCAPRFSILNLPLGGGSDLGIVLLVAAAFGGALGLGLVVAGDPDSVPHRPQSFFRLLASSTVMVVVYCVIIIFLGGGADLCGFFLGGMLFAIVAAALAWLAQRFGTLVATPLAHWLEPDADIEAMDSATVRARFDVAQAERKLRESLRVTDAARRATLLEEARLALERAEAGGAPGASPGWLELRRAEVALALGDLGDAERLAPLSAFAPAIAAEVARRRGDPEAAVRIAEAWLEGVADEESGRARATRASGHALIALARADQGRLDDARSALAEAQKLSAVFPRTFQHLTNEAVEAYIASCAERSRPA